MSMQVNFYQGLASELNTLKAGSKLKAGSFYLTTDTRRLYYGNANNDLLDLNKYIIFKNSISELSNETGAYGDIYYCTNENVLATKKADGTWIQINTNTDTKTTGLSVDETYTANDKIHLKLTLSETTYGSGMDPVSAEKSVEFDITKDEILTVVPIAVDVTGTLSGNTLSIDTTGLGSADTHNLDLVAGNGMSFVSNGEGSFTVKGTTYDMHSAGTSGSADGTTTAGTAKITLSDDQGKAGKDGKSIVSFEAGNQLVLDGSTADKIVYKHAEITTTPSSKQHEQNAGHAATLSYVKSITEDNGHVTGIVTETYTLPAAQDFKPTVTINGGSITVETKDASTGKGGTSTVTDGLYYTIGDHTDKYYNTASLPVYLKSEIDNKLRMNDAMTYKGTVSGNNPLPVSGVSVGDTYKATSKGIFENRKFINAEGNPATAVYYEIGDLFIAFYNGNADGNGEDANGHLTDITWSHVPAGDNTDTTYDLSVLNTKVSLINKNDNTSQSDVEFKVGTENEDLLVSGPTSAATTGGVITYKHKTYTQKTAVNTNKGKVDYSTPFTVVTGLDISNGHVQGLITETITMPDKSVGVLKVADNATKITLTDKTHGTDWGNVLFTDDDYVNISRTDANTLALSHKVYDEPKSSKDDANLEWGKSLPAIYEMVVDNGHVDSYSIRNQMMPKDPSLATITMNSATANSTVQSFNTPFSSTGTAKTLTFSTSNDSVDFASSQNADVAVNFVWRTFASQNV